MDYLITKPKKEEEEEVIDPAWKSLPGHVSHRGRIGYLLDVLPRHRTYIKHEGSDTNPPIDNNTAWYLDSGSCCHAANDKSWFKTLSSCSEWFGTAEQGSLSHHKGRGTVVLYVQKPNGKVAKVTIHDVWYAPTQSGNILSLSELALTGVTGTWGPRNFTLFQPDGRKLCEALPDNGLYYLPLHKKAEADTIETSHPATDLDLKSEKLTDDEDDSDVLTDDGEADSEASDEEMMTLEEEVLGLQNPPTDDDDVHSLESFITYDDDNDDNDSQASYTSDKDDDDEDEDTQMHY